MLLEFEQQRPGRHVFELTAGRTPVPKRGQLATESVAAGLRILIQQKLNLGQLRRAKRWFWREFGRRGSAALLFRYPCFSGVFSERNEGWNRFNGFDKAQETVETVVIAVAFRHAAKAGCDG